MPSGVKRARLFQMVINLRQNTNDDSTAFGKWFAEVDSKEPLNLKGFAKHMTSHGKIADYQRRTGHVLSRSGRPG